MNLGLVKLWGILIFCRGECKLLGEHLKNLLNFKMHLPYDPENLLLATSLEKEFSVPEAEGKSPHCSFPYLSEKLEMTSCPPLEEWSPKPRGLNPMGYCAYTHRE